ncbi:hypothetical protein [Motilibacter aurantiacus]|uniref:hypothetical protein n=1 Tax=Motilibacter aurantiacus TaxID=2714955 RepID=UPI001409DA24|nr:hypothetical protein [Motilibacter aurantiacus]NHC44037.1 hypothetical protein [Motilibacter aurantiacus]
MTIGEDNGDRAQPATATASPLVSDGQATLDLRTRPTRESLGMLPGENGHFEDRPEGSDGIRTTVLLPGGQSVELLAFSLGSESLGSPLSPPPDSKTAPPSSTVVNVNYPSVSAAAEQLYAYREALGLDETGLASVAGPDPGGGGAAGGGSGFGVIQGLREGFLHIEVELRPGTESNPVTANYLFRYSDQAS